MKVEDVAGVGFAAGWLAGEQRDLPVRRRMFGQIVDYHQRVLAVVAEMLGHRHAGERGDPLQPWRCGRGGDDKDAALGRAMGSHGIDNAGHR